MRILSTIRDTALPLLASCFLSGHAFGISMSGNMELAKTGARLSTINLDDPNFDSAIGVGGFAEMPLDSRIKVGVALDYWKTDLRYVSGLQLRDIALAGFGKYYIQGYQEHLAPYAMAGLGLHFLSSSVDSVDDSDQKMSLDMGAGVEAKMTEYISLNGEIKFRNLDDYGYTDFAIGAVAKF